MSSAPRKRKGGATKDDKSAKKPKASAVRKPPRKPKGMIELPVGTELTDLTKQKWTLGKLIGWGGFGALYLASSGSNEADENAEYVIKVEPHANGPLFTELAFYQRVAKPESIKSWMKAHSLKHLGVPCYLGSGSVEHKNAKMRFMVMERYHQDVDNIFLKHGRKFEISTVLTLGLRMLDVLEYIHANEYAHADIKGSNLMTGFGKGKSDQVYLLDYGLTFRFCPNGEHKEYKEDPKRKHDGTVEFTSRDAHRGVAPSRRGDLEILGYVMLQWLCGRLPWEDKLNDKEYVKDKKMTYMDDIPKLLKDCGLTTDSTELKEFLQYVATLEYDQAPDYSRLRKMFQNGLKKRGVSDDGRSVHFTSPPANGHDDDSKKKKTVQSKQKAKGTKSSQESEDDFLIVAPMKKSAVKPNARRKPKVVKVKSSSTSEEEKSPVAPKKKLTKTTKKREVEENKQEENHGVVTHAPMIGFPKMPASRKRPSTGESDLSESEPKKRKEEPKKQTKTTGSRKKRV